MPNDLKPCPHMRTLVSAWLDNQLHGLALWYTKRHVAHCRRCQSSAPFLRTMHSRLRELGEPDPEALLTPDRWEKVENAWDQAERALRPASKH